MLEPYDYEEKVRVLRSFGFEREDVTLQWHNAYDQNSVHLPERLLRSYSVRMIEILMECYREGKWKESNSQEVPGE